MATETKTEHPHVTRDPEICGGSPVVAGTRIPVWQIAEDIHRGQSTEKIIAQYAGRLSPAAIHDAISYYYDHEAEVVHEIWLNTSDVALAAQLRRLGARRGDRGVIRFGASVDNVLP